MTAPFFQTDNIIGQMNNDCSPCFKRTIVLGKLIITAPLFQTDSGVGQINNDCSLVLDGQWYWANEETEAPGDEKKERCWWKKASTDVERTAYAGMAFMCKDGRANVREVIPIVKWLITQQNPYGGYASTQVLITN